MRTASHTIHRIDRPIFCINLLRSTDRRRRMERRFAERGLLDRVRFVDAVDGKEIGFEGDDWAKSARGCFASHLEVMQIVASDGSLAESGAIVFEDDALIHREFAARSEAALANLPRDAGQCVLGFMLAPPNPDLVWAGRDPALHNLWPLG